MRVAVVLGLCLCFMGVGAAAQVRMIKINPTNAVSVTGKDDIAQLKNLAAGVGWEFEPNAETNAGLKHIGIKRIRCIHVAPVPGRFDEKGNYSIDLTADDHIASKLANHLATCKAVGALPHIIIAHGLHSDLRLKAEDITIDRERVLGLFQGHDFGPTDWRKFRNVIKANFEYILVRLKITDAQFEVGNEPDIGGSFAEFPPKPPRGSRELYEAYFKLYRNVAQAAVEFEAEHPGLHVRLGGPALAWAYTFRYGAVNWSEQFLKDVGAEKIKLDFVGVHYYGNISPLAGDRKWAAYPTFSEMFGLLRGWRNRYVPNADLCITEWGGSYDVNERERKSVVPNAGHVGATFAAAFLNQMLIEGVDEAIYLVTTDGRTEKDGAWMAEWGWPSLFTNPTIHGTHPEAPYHVFDMVNRMAPKRVEAGRPDGTLGIIVSTDDRARMTVLLWNHSHTIPEQEFGRETGQDEAIVLRIVGADSFFKGKSVQMKHQLISETVSNALYYLQKGEKLDDRVNLQTVDTRSLKVLGDKLDIAFILPPSSVSFIELTCTGQK